MYAINKNSLRWEIPPIIKFIYGDYSPIFVTTILSVLCGFPCHYDNFKCTLFTLSCWYNRYAKLYIIPSFPLLDFITVNSVAIKIIPIPHGVFSRSIICPCASFNYKTCFPFQGNIFHNYEPHPRFTHENSHSLIGNLCMATLSQSWTIKKVYILECLIPLVTTSRSM